MFVVIQLLKRNNLVSKTSGIPGGSRQLLASQSKLVLHFPGNPVLPRQIFRGGRHVAAAIRIQQPHHQPIFELTVTQPQSPTRPTNHVRRLAHRFHSSGKNDARLAQLN
jgi:hypothetical protein